MHLATAALLCFFAAAGCSFSANAPPPNYAPATHGYPSCDRDIDGRAVLDGLGAGTAITGPVIFTTLMVAGESDLQTSDDGLAPMVISAGLAAVFFMALRTGFKKTAKCEAAHVKYETWYEQRTGRAL